MNSKVGFWRRSKNNVDNELPWPSYLGSELNNLPFPKPSENPSRYERLEELLNILNNIKSENVIDLGYGRIVKIVVYMGSSRCRLCKCFNGNLEYTIEDSDGVSITFPQGYLHYLKEHNVEIDKFLEETLDKWCELGEYLNI